MDPYNCNCAICQKMGPLYVSMNKNGDNLSIPECTVIKEESNKINKNNIINVVWIFIILFLLISSKFYII